MINYSIPTLRNKMGDQNQLLYAKTIFKGFKGKILEIGSKDYGNTQPFRQIFSGNEYIGIDIEEGKNVDYIIDLENGLGDLEGKKFDLIIVCSVLEHMKKPWLAAQNITNLLSSNGIVFSSHPWVWRYHKYPEDYFRFSPKGIQSLFNEISYWLPMLYATRELGEFYSFSKNEFVDDFHSIKIKTKKSERKYLPCLQTMMAGTRSQSSYKSLMSNFKNSFT